MSNDLPNGWEAVPLKDLVVPRGDRVSPQSLPDAPFVGMEHVEPHTNQILRTVPSSAMASNAARFYEGDVLYGRMRPYLNKVILPSFDGLASAEFIVFPKNDLVENRFLLRRLSSSDFTEFACGQYEGDRPRVKFDQLGAFKVLLPPAAEQARIVEKLEELLSDLDAGVAELKAAQRKLTQYRQSLLKAAVEGRLTADWRAAQGTPKETGAELLRRILIERRARWEEKQLAKFAEQGKAPPKGWQAKYTEPLAPDFADLPTLPGGWTWTSLGHCFAVAVGATPSRKEPSYWDGSIPWVSSGEIKFNRISVTRERITDLGLNNTSTQVNPVGSVLLGMIGEGKTRGQVAILDIEAANNQNCAAVWVSETSVPPEFVYYWLWSRYEDTRRDSSGNNQPALNKAIVERIPLPLAPLAEMREIVSRAEGAMAEAFRQEAAIARALRQAEAQRKNLLKAAFAGQLVPQDPADEPASELLARIRAAREQSLPTRGQRRAGSNPAPATSSSTPGKRGRRAKVRA